MDLRLRREAADFLRTIVFSVEAAADLADFEEDAMRSWILCAVPESIPQICAI